MNATGRTDNAADVPFISRARDEAPFADLRNRGGIDNPKGMLEGWTLPEAKLGVWNTVQAALIGQLAEKSRAVARINISSGEMYGTGFLVAENLLLTNNHVLASVAAAKNAVAEFNYELSREHLQSGHLPDEPSIKRYRLDPDRLFITSPYEGGLDYSFVWIDTEASRKFGAIEMRRASFTVDRDEPVFIIHHPQGRPKEVSVDDTEVLGIDCRVVQYAADTDYGSSGAPVIDRSGRLIALHHARKAVAPVKLQDGGTTTVVNEGIKIAAIAMDLENRIKKRSADAGMAEQVLSAMAGSDTLAGFFGGLGRSVRGENDAEAVVNAYLGTDEDVDIGFWNMEWLAGREQNDKLLQGTARAIAGFNLDLWCLEDISPRAVRQLAQALLERYGESYSLAMQEQDAPDSERTTAVIWKPHNIVGGKLEWPDPICGWWSLGSRDGLPFEAVHGRIFNCAPSLFRFAVKGRGKRAPFAFNLVPLNLRAMADGRKRRRLAALLIARAITQMTELGANEDWIIGGGVNAELEAADFAALTGAGVIALSAMDEEAGAFTYLKSPGSPIDNIFITDTVTRMTGGANDFVVAQGKSVDGLIERLSDHRPVVLRASLAAGKAAEASLNDAALKVLVDRIASGAARQEKVRRLAHR